jgi:hypothetical protein
MTIQRTKIQILHESDVGIGVTTNESTAIPDGESWQINRVIFGDMSLNDTKTGIFKVDFGDDTAREILAMAYLTGNTMIFDVNKTFIGDGTKTFMFYRESQSNPAKKMFILMQGFKRIGDI